MEKYPLIMRALHWLMAFVIILLIAVGLRMTDIPRSDPMHDTIYALHKSLGVTALLLCLLRIYFRLRLSMPPMPQVISALEQKLAHAGHYLFYAFGLAMPISGYLMTNAFGFPVKFFGLELPKVIGADKALGGMLADFHSYAGFTLIGLIALHVAGVVKHYVSEHVNLLKRMT